MIILDVAVELAFSALLPLKLLIIDRDNLRNDVLSVKGL